MVRDNRNTDPEILTEIFHAGCWWGGGGGGGGYGSWVSNTAVGKSEAWKSVVPIVVITLSRVMM